MTSEGRDPDDGWENDDQDQPHDDTPRVGPVEVGFIIPQNGAWLFHPSPDALASGWQYEAFASMARARRMIRAQCGGPCRWETFPGSRMVRAWARDPIF